MKYDFIKITIKLGIVIFTLEFSQQPLQFWHATAQGSPCFLHEQLADWQKLLHLHQIIFKISSNAQGSEIGVGEKASLRTVQPY